jgi:DNA-binding transcriptional LysR family regulator
MDRIAAMTAFVRVVEAGSFTKAADTLDLPNASVTRLIQGLEDDLKVRLLHRTTRSVTVTAEGATYYERALRLLADLADIESSTRQSRAKPSGRIRIESSGALATLVIVPALPDFSRQYPDITVDLGIGHRQADLVAEGVDCAVRVGDIIEQNLVARRVGEFRIVTCATPAFVAEHGAPSVPADLAHFCTVGLLSNRTGRPFQFRYSNGSGSVELALDHPYVVSDTNAFLAAGLAGLGIIQAPAYAVSAPLNDGRLVALLEDWWTDTYPVNVVYPANRYLSAKVRLFIDWLVALFDQHEDLRRRR